MAAEHLCIASLSVLARVQQVAAEPYPSDAAEHGHGPAVPLLQPGRLWPCCGRWPLRHLWSPAGSSGSGSWHGQPAGHPAADGARDAGKQGLLPELADVCCLSKAASGSQAGSTGCPLARGHQTALHLENYCTISQMQQPTIFACAACIVDQLPAPWGCCTSTCFVICSPASWLNCSAWGL